MILTSLKLETLSTSPAAWADHFDLFYPVLLTYLHVC